MKKIFKILWKVVFGYFIANTLALAYAGAGRYFNDAYSGDIKYDNIIELVNYELDEGTVGWKKFFKDIRSSFKR